MFNSDRQYFTREDVVRETRHLTVTVDGEERGGVGIYVGGFDFRKRDVVEMRRMMLEGEAMTLIVRGQQIE